jgi:hypothetical protein
MLTATTLFLGRKKMTQTIRQFIAELSAIENQDQPIFAVHWLAEDFEFGDGTPSPTPEQFGQVVGERNFEWQDLAEQINDRVYDLMSDFGECDTCEKQYELSSRDGRCGECGECAEHCEHESENA